MLMIGQSYTKIEHLLLLNLFEPNMKTVYQETIREENGDYRSSNWKVTQTNMIYIVGLPPSIASI
jgi:hypothetical protein